MNALADRPAAAAMIRGAPARAPVAPCPQAAMPAARDPNRAAGREAGRSDPNRAAGRALAPRIHAGRAPNGAAGPEPAAREPSRAAGRALALRIRAGRGRARTLPTRPACAGLRHVAAALRAPSPRVTRCEQPRCSGAGSHRLPRWGLPIPGSTRARAMAASILRHCVAIGIGLRSCRSSNAPAPTPP